MPLIPRRGELRGCYRKRVRYAARRPPTLRPVPTAALKGERCGPEVNDGMCAQAHSGVAGSVEQGRARTRSGVVVSGARHFWRRSCSPSWCRSGLRRAPGPKTHHGIRGSWAAHVRPVSAGRQVLGDRPGQGWEPGRSRGRRRSRPLPEDGANLQLDRRCRRRPHRRADPHARRRQARDGDHGRLACPPFGSFVRQREVAVRHGCDEVHARPRRQRSRSSTPASTRPGPSSPAASPPASI